MSNENKENIEFIAIDGTVVTTQKLNQMIAEAEAPEWDSRTVWGEPIYFFPNGEEKKEETLNIKVTEEMKNAIVRESKKMNITPSEFVRRVLSQSLMEQ